MAAREPTQLETLRDAGRYIDHSLLPSQNEIPGVLAALIYGNDFLDHVGQLRQDGKTDAEISHEVAHWIAPPDPDAGANIVQGVPQEAHEALLDEVAQLRQAVAEMRGPAAPTQTPGQTTANAPAVNAPETMTSEQQELQALREQVQQMRVQEAAGQHPTATSEPGPASGADEPTPPAEAA